MLIRERSSRCSWCLRPLQIGPIACRTGWAAMNNRLRVLRAEHGWSQADLADKLEVSRQSVNAIETGKYDPSLPLAFRLARLFGKRIEEIFEDR
jgi:putative transcriptional regulator